MVGGGNRNEIFLHVPTAKTEKRTFVFFYFCDRERKIFLLLSTPFVVFPRLANNFICDIVSSLCPGVGRT